VVGVMPDSMTNMHLEAEDNGEEFEVPMNVW
jgi:hypothetical protein